jgi:hypothetical protein
MREREREKDIECWCLCIFALEFDFDLIFLNKGEREIDRINGKTRQLIMMTMPLSTMDEPV